MNFKKNVLSTAVCLAATGLSAGVQAAAFNIDLTGAALTAQTLTYANESTVLTLTDTGSAGANVHDFVGILNPNSVPNATDVRVKIDLSNGAKFTAAPTMHAILDKGPDNLSAVSAGADAIWDTADDLDPGFSEGADGIFNGDDTATSLGADGILNGDDTVGGVLPGADGIFNGDDTAISLGANLKPDGDDVAVANSDGNSKVFSIFSGGAGQSTVTFNGNAGLGFDPSRNLSIQLNGITVASHNPVTATVTIQAADNFGSTELKKLSDLPYLAFADALAPKCTAGTVERIDVSQTSFFFDGAKDDASTPLGTIQLAFTPRLDVTSAVIANGNTILSNLAVTLTNSGGWAPVTVADTLAPAYTITGNSAARTVATALAYAPILPVTASVPAANTTAMNQGSIAAVFVGTANAGYTATSSSSTCSLSSLVKNGSSDRITFLLTPQSEGGVFKGWVRISNPSTVGGNVTLKLTNDLGVSSTFPMSAITGLSAALAAKTSTGLISNDALLAAAKTVVPTFTALVDTNGDGVKEKGKLRLEVDAEFGDGSNAVSSKTGILGTHAPTGVNVQAVTTATDNTSFFTTQPE